MAKAFETSRTGLLISWRAEGSSEEDVMIRGVCRGESRDYLMYHDYEACYGSKHFALLGWGTGVISCCRTSGASFIFVQQASKCISNVDSDYCTTTRVRVKPFNVAWNKKLPGLGSASVNFTVEYFMGCIKHFPFHLQAGTACYFCETEQSVECVI